MFATAGTVESASVVEDRDTGRSRGFGFVEMSSKEEGAAAIAQFNGKEVNGRALNVNEAKPRENRGGGGGGRGGYGGGGGRGGGYGGNRGGGGRDFGGRDDRPGRDPVCRLSAIAESRTHWQRHRLKPIPTECRAPGNFL